ncbi:MAG: hypothetical protein ACOYBC_05605 [Bilifractor sp.]
MEEYKVGKTYVDAIGRNDELIFDITDSGIIIPVYFNRPNQNEIDQFKSGHGIKMAYVDRGNVLIILMKFGALHWMDAPYSPHLSKQLTRLPDKVENEEGFAAHLLLFDTANGELKTQRLFSLRSKMSNDLIRETKKLLNKPFDRNAYDADIQSAYRYRTSELVKQARQIYEIQ